MSKRFVSDGLGFRNDTATCIPADTWQFRILNGYLWIEINVFVKSQLLTWRIRMFESELCLRYVNICYKLISRANSSHPWSYKAHVSKSIRTNKSTFANWTRTRTCNVVCYAIFCVISSVFEAELMGYKYNHIIQSSRFYVHTKRCLPVYCRCSFNYCKPGKWFSLS